MQVEPVLSTAHVELIGLILLPVCSIGGAILWHLVRIANNTGRVVQKVDTMYGWFERNVINGHGVR